MIIGFVGKLFKKGWWIRISIIFVSFMFKFIYKDMFFFSVCFICFSLSFMFLNCMYMYMYMCDVYEKYVDYRIYNSMWSKIF